MSDHSYSVAFLGYAEQETRLIVALRELGHRVIHFAGPVLDLSAYDFVVSFGYRHILHESVLDTAQHDIMNLHISYLPFNRGAHPNFWAWIDGTPHGVTLHAIDTGLDTGPVFAQRIVELDDDTVTLRDSQAQLIHEIEALFLGVLPRWFSGKLPPVPQTGRGSYHAARDLPKWVSWDMPVASAKERFHAKD